MNEASLGSGQSAGAQSDTRRYLMKLPPALFRAHSEVESKTALLPSAFALGQLALRPTRAVLAGQLLFCIDAHAGWFTSEPEAQRAGCDLADSLFWREEFVRGSVGGRVSARRILAAEPGRYLWPHLHFLPMGSPCVANCTVREDFSKGAHSTSISVFAACDLEAFEQELFVRAVVTPWARARGPQRSDAQAMRNTGGEEARAKSESGMKRRRRGRKPNASTPSGTPSGTEEDEEAEDEEEEDEEEKQEEEEKVGQQYRKPTIGGSPSTDVTTGDGFGEGDGRKDAFAGGSGKDPSGAQHSEGVGSSDGTRASGTKMVCEVEGLDIIWRNGQAELQLPAGAPDDASKQVPANTRLCLVGSIAGAGGGQSLIPAAAPPEGYGGPVFEFELHAKSMIVTDESAKPLKLSKWWLDLPSAAGDNAGAVWWHNAAIDDGHFTIAKVDNPPRSSSRIIRTRCNSRLVSRRCGRCSGTRQTSATSRTSCTCTPRRSASSAPPAVSACTTPTAFPPRGATLARGRARARAHPSGERNARPASRTIAAGKAGRAFGPDVARRPWFLRRVPRWRARATR